MTEVGVIREINEDRIIVIPTMGPACFGCMNQQCKDNGGLIIAENPKALPIMEGQKVRVRPPGLYLLGYIMATLLPPAFGFATGFFLVRRLFPGAGEGVIAGIVAGIFFATAFLVYKIRKKIPANMPYTVMRIVTHTDSLNQMRSVP